MATEKAEDPKALEATKKIKLAFPIEVSGVKVGEVTMRRPKVRDRLVVANDTELSQEAAEVRFIANLCALLSEDIEEMDFLDYNKLQKALRSFTSSAA